MSKKLSALENVNLLELKVKKLKGLLVMRLPMTFGSKYIMHSD